MGETRIDWSGEWRRLNVGSGAGVVSARVGKARLTREKCMGRVVCKEKGQRDGWKKMSGARFNWREVKGMSRERLTRGK